MLRSVAAPRSPANAIDLAPFIYCRGVSPRCATTEMPGAHEQLACGIQPYQFANRFIENSNLLAPFPPGYEHRSDNQRDLCSVQQQSLTFL
jgi:hypothetical protein